MMLEVGIGTRTEAFVAADLAGLPAAGDLQYDTAYQAFFRLLMNNAATAITARLVATAVGLEKTLYQCQLSAATDCLEIFAGVRVAGADSLAQNCYGYFQVSGNASFLHSGGAAVVIDTHIQTSATVAGKVEGVTASDVGSLAGFAVAAAGYTVLDEVVLAAIDRCLYR